MKTAPLSNRRGTKRDKSVIGAKGQTMTSTNFREMLPPKDFSGRWTASKKADVGQAVRAGFITLDEVLKLYPFTTADEVNTWITNYAAYGLTGVKVTKIQTFGEHQRSE